MFENKKDSCQLTRFLSHLKQYPHAIAIIRGSRQYPQIHGSVRFYQTQYGVLTAAELFGLPSPEEVCKSPVFGFHIHEGGECSGNKKDPFADTGMHYDPNGCEHPYHAGDMPPLFGNHGYALSIFLTDRFPINDIIGKAIIVHSMPDDFHTQPSGNSGDKIACGLIRALDLR
ncbi:MAG: superoxide dismutase family protein [Eubacteriales bacterium]|nr:superoxide dismutase family protein [Eubacteriales bacterium]